MKSPYKSCLMVLVLTALSSNTLANFSINQQNMARELFSSSNFIDNNKSYNRDYYPPNGCHVKVTETTQLTFSYVGAYERGEHLGEMSVQLSYYCHRPDHHYKCGGGPWTTPQRAHYQGTVFANIVNAGGSLYVKDLLDQPESNTSNYKKDETDCGELLIDFIRSKSGTPIGN